MFKTFIKALQDSQMRRVQYWQLVNMSDALLRDIGVTRGEIKQKFYGKDYI